MKVLLILGACLLALTTAQDTEEIPDYEVFLERVVLNGEQGTIVLDLQNCLNRPNFTADIADWHTIHWETGNRYVDTTENIDYLTTNDYALRADGKMYYSEVIIDSTGFVTQYMSTVKMPELVSEFERVSVCKISNQAKFYVLNDRDIKLVDTYEQIKDAYRDGRRVAITVDGDKCASPELKGLKVVVDARDWRIFNEGTGAEQIELELDFAGRVDDEGQYALVYNQFFIRPSGTVTIVAGAFDLDGNAVGDPATFVCSFGEEGAVIGHERAGGASVIQDTFDEIKEEILDGRVASINIDTRNPGCIVDPDGDDIFAGNIVNQHRLISQWEWYLNFPGLGGEGIQSNHYFYGMNENGAYLIQENIDISSNGFAYVHINAYNFTTGDTSTTFLSCKIDRTGGMSLSVPRGGNPNLVTDPEEFVTAARDGSPLSVYVNTLGCVTDDGSPVTTAAIIGAYLSEIESEDPLFPIEFSTHQMIMQVSEAGSLFFSVHYFKMQPNGYWNILNSVYNAKTFEILPDSQTTYLCPWETTTVHRGI